MSYAASVRFDNNYYTLTVVSYSEDSRGDNGIRGPKTVLSAKLDPSIASYVISMLADATPFVPKLAVINDKALMEKIERMGVECYEA